MLLNTISNLHRAVTNKNVVRSTEIFSMKCVIYKQLLILKNLYKIYL